MCTTWAPLLTVAGLKTNVRHCLVRLVWWLMANTPPFFSGPQLLHTWRQPTLLINALWFFIAQPCSGLDLHKLSIGSAMLLAHFPSSSLCCCPSLLHWVPHSLGPMSPSSLSHRVVYRFPLCKVFMLEVRNWNHHDFAADGRRRPSGSSWIPFGAD